MRCIVDKFLIPTAVTTTCCPVAASCCGLLAAAVLVAGHSLAVVPFRQPPLPHARSDQFVELVGLQQL